MGLRIQNNIAALNSYNSVNRTDKSVSSSLEKLSSGYRINKAADDAAGLVVSEGLRSQIGGLTVASRNAQDGVNVAQTADGALSTVTDILQRMRDLSVQSANSGSQDTAAQTAANTEFTQLKSELDRISQTTSFGGKQLLDGSFAGTFQVGANNTSNDQININLDSSIFGTPTGYTAGTKASMAAPTVTGLTGDKIVVSNGKNSVTVELSADITDAAGLATELNKSSAFKDSFTVDAAGIISNKANGAGNTFSLTQIAAADGAVTDLTEATTDGSATVFRTATGFNAEGLQLKDISIDDTAGAQEAIDAITQALSGVSTARAQIGAVQNRFEHAINNLSVSIENITASESAIRDTDMAAEMTKFTKNQILSQAGTSMLAQANSSTQNILTLLRG